MNSRDKGKRGERSKPMEKKKINFTRLVESLRWYEKEYKGSIMDEEDKKTFSLAADALEAADNRIAELEAQKPKRGEWIEKWRFKTDGTPFHKIGDMECSVCHGDMLGRYYSKYCPHCGALLRGEHDEQD